MEEFVVLEDGVTLRSYRGEGGEIAIPEGITEIEAQAFKGNGRITSVRCPMSLKRIGWEAFEGCFNLRSITFSEGLEEIGARAFENCTSLTEVGFPKHMKPWTEMISFRNTPVCRAYEEERERREKAYLAVRDRVRRKLSNDEVRSLKTILVEDNPCVKAVGFYSYYRTLSGGYSPEVGTLLSARIPLSDLAGKPPYEEFGMFVRAVVDDTVYLTAGLGPNARVISFDERNGYEAAGRGSYDAAVTEEIYASRDD